MYIHQKVLLMTFVRIELSISDPLLSMSLIWNIENPMHSRYPMMEQVAHRYVQKIFCGRL